MVAIQNEQLQTEADRCTPALTFCISEQPQILTERILEQVTTGSAVQLLVYSDDFTPEVSTTIFNLTAVGVPPLTAYEIGYQLKLEQEKGQKLGNRKRNSYPELTATHIFSDYIDPETAEVMQPNPEAQQVTEAVLNSIVLLADAKASNRKTRQNLKAHNFNPDDLVLDKGRSDDSTYATLGLLESVIPANSARLLVQPYSISAAEGKINSHLTRNLTIELLTAFHALDSKIGPLASGNQLEIFSRSLVITAQFNFESVKNLFETVRVSNKNPVLAKLPTFVFANQSVLTAIEHLRVRYPLINTQIQLDPIQEPPFYSQINRVMEIAGAKLDLLSREEITDMVNEVDPYLFVKGLACGYAYNKINFLNRAYGKNTNRTGLLKALKSDSRAEMVQITREISNLLDDTDTCARFVELCKVASLPAALTSLMGPDYDAFKL